MALSATQAIESILTMHVLIEKIFSGRHAEQDLAQLNQYFSEQFEMVGAAGKRIQYAQVLQLFKNNQGNLSDLKIEISDPEVVLLKDDAALLNYTETHHRDAGTTSRRASALLVEEKGKMLWRYLQETFLV